MLCAPFVKPSVLTDVQLTAVAACYAFGTSLFGRPFTHWKENMLCFCVGSFCHFDINYIKIRIVYRLVTRMTSQQLYVDIQFAKISIFLFI